MQHHIAIGQPGHVVVVVRSIGGQFIAPDQIAFPIEPFEAPSNAAAIEGLAANSRGPKQGAIAEEVRRFPRAVIAVPLVDDPSAIVDQMGPGGAVGATRV